MGPIGCNSRKRYQSKIRKIAQQHRTRQTTILEKLRAQDEEDQGAGDQISRNKDEKSMRILLQNPNGLRKNIHDVDNVCALQDLSQLKVNILGLSETNINWNNPIERDKWRSMILRAWPKSKVLTASIRDGADHR